MKNIKKLLISVLAAMIAVTLFAFVACGEENGENGGNHDNATVTGIELVTTNAQTTFELGDSFTYAGLQVDAAMSDGSKRQTFAEDCEVTAPDMTVRGVKTVTVKYGEFSASYEILVREIKDIHVNIDGATTEFLPNAEFSYSGVTVYAEYYDIADWIAVSDFTVTAPDMTTLGEKTVTVQYLGKTFEYKILINVEMNLTLDSAHLFEENGKVLFTVSGKLENYIGDKSDIKLDIQRISPELHLDITSTLDMADDGTFTITGNLSDSKITSTGDYLIHLSVRDKSYDVRDLTTAVDDELNVGGVVWTMKSEERFSGNPMKFVVVRVRSESGELFSYILTGLNLSKVDDKAYVEFTGSFTGMPIDSDFTSIYFDCENNPNEFGSGDWGFRGVFELEIVSAENGVFVLRAQVDSLPIMAYTLHFGGTAGDIHIVQKEQSITVGNKTYTLVCDGTHFWGGSGLRVDEAEDPAALKHFEAKEATCTEDGNIEYWTADFKFYTDAECTNEVEYDTLILPATGHTPATAWSIGDGKHWHECTVCHEVAGEKADHTAGEWLVDADDHYKNCTVCGKTAVEKTAHAFVWVVDKAATDDEDGVRHEECECGTKRNENTVIPALVKTVHYDAAPATCTENGNIEYWEKGGKYYTDVEFQTEVTFDQTVIPAIGHDYATSVYEAGKFYKVCANDTAHKSEIDASDKSISVNGTALTPYECHDTADSGITYDPLKEVFTVDIAAVQFADGEKALTLGSNATVVLSVTAATTLDSLTFTSANSKALYIRGTAKLIAGAIDTGVNPLVIESDMDIMSSVGAVHDLTVGNAENSVQPTVAITSNPDGEGVNSSEGVDLAWCVLSGKMTITQSGSGNCGISLHRAGDAIIVGEHGTLEITGFGIAIVNWSAVSTVTVDGILTVNGSDNSGALKQLNFVITGTATSTGTSTNAFNGCTITVKDGGSLTAIGAGDALSNSHLTVGNNGTATVKGKKGIGGGSVTVNGENAVLNVTSNEWGAENAGVSLLKGEAHFTMEGNGVPGFSIAPFCTPNNMVVSAGFKLYVKNYNKVVNFWGDGSVSIADGTLYIENVNQLDGDGYITSGMIAEDSEQKKN